MLKRIAFAAVAVFGLSSVAAASMIVPAIGGNNGSLTVEVAEHCGGGMWRGPGGACHPFVGRGGNNRGTEFACPDGLHYGRNDRCYRD